MKRIKLTITISVLFIALQVNAQDIIIDGRFNEPAWKNARSFTGFKTYKSDIGQDASESTCVMVTNDSLNIYFAIICKDSEPTKIMANLSKRDNISNDDSFTIEMDMGGNARSNLFFKVNPLGIQEDGVIFQNEDVDLNPDKVWFSRGTITGNGYQVEIAIPFQSLRFKREPVVGIGMGFKRTIYRKSETVVYPEYNEEISNRLIQREVLKFSGIQNKSVLEVIPSTTYTYKEAKKNGQWEAESNSLQAGVTGKIGLNSELVMDLTYNPDFSHIESDAGQVDINLRNALWYPEKRPFFQEGVELFQYGTQDWYDMPFKFIVNTRNIVDPLYGIKLTGKVSKNLSVASIITTDNYQDHPEHYQILRAKRSTGDDGYLGVIYTGKEFLYGSNRIGGVDGIIRINGKSNVQYYFLRSLTEDSIYSFGGNSYEIAYKFKHRYQRLKIGYSQIDKNFETQIGHLERNGIQILPVAYSAIFPVSSKWLTRAGIIFHARPKKDLYSDKYEHSTSVGLHLNFNNSGYLQAGKRFSTEVFQNESFNTSAYQLYYFIQPYKFFSSEGYIRWGNQIYYDPGNPYGGYGWMTYHTITIIPGPQLKIQFTGRYADFRRKTDDQLVYDYTLARISSSFQLNKYLFIRATGEHNFYKDKFYSDFVLAFNYIPGTALQFGYTMNAEKNLPDEHLNPVNNLQINQKLFFFKASYMINRSSLKGSQ